MTATTRVGPVQRFLEFAAVTLAGIIFIAEFSALDSTALSKNLLFIGVRSWGLDVVGILFIIKLVQLIWSFFSHGTSGAGDVWNKFTQWRTGRAGIAAAQVEASKKNRQAVLDRKQAGLGFWKYLGRRLGGAPSDSLPGSPSPVVGVAVWKEPNTTNVVNVKWTPNDASQGVIYYEIGWQHTAFWRTGEKFERAAGNASSIKISMSIAIINKTLNAEELHIRIRGVNKIGPGPWTDSIGVPQNNAPSASSGPAAQTSYAAGLNNAEQRIATMTTALLPPIITALTGVGLLDPSGQPTGTSLSMSTLPQYLQAAGLIPPGANPAEVVFAWQGRLLNAQSAYARLAKIDFPTARSAIQNLENNGQFKGSIPDEASRYLNLKAEFANIKSLIANVTAAILRITP